jgi:hypothetical protein
MTASSIMQPVLRAKPVANVDAQINGLLDELRERICGRTVAPGQNVSLSYREFMELRGAFVEMSGTVRNRIRWAK